MRPIPAEASLLRRSRAGHIERKKVRLFSPFSHSSFVEKPRRIIQRRVKVDVGGQNAEA